MAEIVKDMEALARKWHEGQFRKGPEHLPYIVHPAAVVQKLRAWGYNDKDDTVTLAVAWGHDLLEDTNVPESEIVAAGGEVVLAGIKTLTFSLPPIPKLSNAEYDAKKDEYIRNVAKTAAPEILVVKMADRICNTMDFLNAGKPAKAKGYVEKGAPLFERATEVKHSIAILSDRDHILAMCV